MIFDDLVAFAAEIDAINLRDSQIIVTVDGLTYTTTKLPCSKGVEIWTHLSALLGPVFPAIVTGKFAGLDPRVVGKVSEQALRLGIVPVLKDLLRSTVVDFLRSGGVMSEKGGNVSMHFDTHFAGEYVHLIKVCMLAVAHNLRGPSLGVH